MSDKLKLTFMRLSQQDVEDAIVTWLEETYGITNVQDIEPIPKRTFVAYGKEQPQT